METKDLHEFAKSGTPHPLSEDLIHWFSENKRDLPWRSTPFAYPVWLCEIMMQQTRIETGMRYWRAFLERWPEVGDLAKAEEEEVLKAWQGLGYYSRARNLLKAARIVALERGGEFPNTAAGLRKLPGVGPYTAAAIASICFGEPVAAVDGNVQRVLSRVVDLAEPVDERSGRRTLEATAEALIHPRRPGDHNEAMMELGALICKPKAPDCPACPIRSHCLAAEHGTQRDRPVKARKTAVLAETLRFVVVTDGVRVWMRKRGEQGVWAGLWTFPLAGDVPDDLGVPGGEAVPSFVHVLTHRRWTLCFEWRWVTTTDEVGEAGGGATGEANGQFLDWEAAGALAMPRAMEKIWSDVEKNARKNAPNQGRNA